MNCKEKYPKHVTVFLFGTIVICLVGILDGRMLKNRLDHAKVYEAKGRMESLKAALDEFRRDNDFYPDTKDGLEALINRPENAKSYPKYGYIKKMPLDPWGSQYQYERLENNFYDIWSPGPDLKSGTKDDVRP